MKKILVSLCLMAITLTYSMEKKADNFLIKLDDKGKTPLHYVAGSEHAHESDLAESDLIRAKLAALLIQRGAEIEVQDSEGRTPLHYAELNQNKLPLVHAVIKAGKLMRDIKKRLPAVSEQELLDWQDAINMINKHAKD